MTAQPDVPTDPEPRPSPREFAHPLWIGVSLVAAAVMLGFAILLGADDAPLRIDTAWNDFLVSVRGPILLTFSYAMNWLGGGWFGVVVLPLGVAIALVIARRPWGALYFISAEAFSALIVQILKHLIGRERPPEMIVLSDFGSFPSGHVANAATIAVALFVLFPRVWVAIVGTIWVVLMAFSRTYLGAHWLSDTFAGALVGVGAALIVAALFAVPLTREARKRRTADASAVRRP